MLKSKAALVFLLLTLIVPGKTLYAQLPDYFQGRVIDEGRKPAWIPDGGGISYTKGDSLIIYNIDDGKSKKIAEMDIAEYIWLNNDSLLAIEWPNNVQAKMSVAKIVKYWIVEKNGNKHLFAADTVVTSRIPGYEASFRLPDGKVAIRKGPRWHVTGFPKTDLFVVFADEDYDIEKGLSKYVYLAGSRVQGGSIHFKNINLETYRTITMGSVHYGLDLSPDHSKLISFADNTILILDSLGEQLADLSKYIETPPGHTFQKFIGPVWNNASDGLAYYELFKGTEDYSTICYFNLNSRKKSVITQVDYYGQKNMEFSPSDKQIVSRYVHSGISYIVVLDKPQVTANEESK